MRYDLFQRRRAGDAPSASSSSFAATVAALPPAASDSLSPELEPPPEHGDIAARPTLSHIGRYALKARLADGGLGTVYEAWDPLLSRTVAVKTLQFKVETPLRVSLDGLFLNEARTAAGLNHRYIVTVHDAGLSEQGVYIAMERLHGQDMRQALAQGWLPTPERAVQLVRRVADALAYAHGRGVVHCDIKPANIFLTRKSRPKVLDFGIARAAHGAEASVLDGLIAGSPHYLSPEQLLGGEIDARCDVYALGVVLYELLTGRKAFDGDSLESIIAAVQRGAPVPALALRPALPPALVEIAAKAMAVKREDRYATAAEMSQALHRWALLQAVMAEGRPSASSTTSANRAGGAWRWWGAGAMVGGGLIWWAGGAQQEPLDAPKLVAPLTLATPAAPSPAIVPLVAEVAPVTMPEPLVPPITSAVAKPKPRTTPTVEPRPTAVLPTAAVQAAATGTLQLAVSPWGQIEVDGNPVGTTPPMTRLTLPEGTHHVTVRNEDFAPYSITVQVSADKPVLIKHRFGP